MSMYDKSYCGCNCEDKNCERNLKYNKPKTRIYTVSKFDETNTDPLHKRCPWRIKKGS